MASSGKLHLILSLSKDEVASMPDPVARASGNVADARAGNRPLGHERAVAAAGSLIVLQALRAVAALLTGGAILLTGNGLAGIALPIRLDLGGVKTDVAGLVMSAYYAGFVGGSFWGQRIIARVGHIRAFAAFAGLLSASTLIYPLWFEPAALGGAARRSTASAWPPCSPPSRAGSTCAARANRRGRILSWYMVASYLGTGAGQFLVNAWGVRGIELFCLAALLLEPVAGAGDLTHAEGPELGHPRAARPGPAVPAVAARRGRRRRRRAS